MLSVNSKHCLKNIDFSLIPQFVSRPKCNLKSSFLLGYLVNTFFLRFLSVDKNILQFI